MAMLKYCISEPDYETLADLAEKGYHPEVKMAALKELRAAAINFADLMGLGKPGLGVKISAENPERKIKPAADNGKDKIKN